MQVGGQEGSTTFSCIFSGLWEKSKILESMSTKRMDWAWASQKGCTSSGQT